MRPATSAINGQARCRFMSILSRRRPSLNCSCVCFGHGQQQHSCQGPTKRAGPCGRTKGAEIPRQLSFALVQPPSAEPTGLTGPGNVEHRADSLGVSRTRFGGSLSADADPKTASSRTISSCRGWPRSCRSRASGNDREGHVPVVLGAGSSSPGFAGSKSLRERRRGGAGPEAACALPAGSPNYVTPRGLEALRAELTRFDRRALPALNAQEARFASRGETSSNGGSRRRSKRPGGDETLEIVAVAYDGASSSGWPVHLSRRAAWKRCRRLQRE